MDCLMPSLVLSLSEECNLKIGLAVHTFFQNLSFTSCKDTIFELECSLFIRSWLFRLWEWNVFVWHPLVVKSVCFCKLPFDVDLENILLFWNAIHTQPVNERFNDGLYASFTLYCEKQMVFRHIRLFAVSFPWSIIR